jgi:serine phosphatase RsbU (regulator of sigma subunit)
VFSQPEIPWIKNEDEWINIGSARSIAYNDKALLKIFDNLNSIYTDENNIWVISGDNLLFRIVRNKIPSIKPDIDLIIRSISNAEGLYFALSDIVFGSGDNTVYFDLVAPGYLKQNSTQYQYIVDKVMTEWSKWSYNNTISLMIKPGKYTLQVRAKDIWGNESEPKTIGFIIEAPFTQTTFFYIIVLSVILIGIIGVIRFRERQLKKEKRMLEKKVEERTAEIVAQKEEITSSIEYASRIQQAMLPEDDHFVNSFSDYFIIFKPRDIVSGDFYWIGEDEKNIFFTVADCTGHGVPGAFMSTLGISTLDEIITNNTDLKANAVLGLLREKIKTSLHQTGKQGEATDGMDLAFCVLHKNRRTLEFSGAYNPLFLFQGGEFKEYRADRMPIGIYYGEKDTFTNYEINVQKGDTLYIFSDGFADQFGGPNGSKYMKYNLKKLLSENCSRSMAEQRNIIENEFEMWKGSVNQIDDVTILGVRI